jgi:hypothetical protein
MSFCIRNTSTSQAPTVNYLSSISNPKVIFEEKPPISSNESVLKFDMTTNSWVWREMNDTGIYCSKGPSGSLVNTQKTETEKQTTTINIQPKKVEMNKNKRRQQKKK